MNTYILTHRFDCSCARTFVTQRGLSLHLSHYPEHKFYKKDTPKKPPDDNSPMISSDAASPSPSPEDPTSPYSLAAFKTSARNPQYYSIIRTRSSSGVEGETGVKRARGGSSGAPPPAKTMMLNSGEKVAVDAAAEEEKLETKRVLKETAEAAKRGRKSGGRAKSANSEPSPDRDGAAAVVGGDGLKNSPVTRSNSATMKAPAFISLPPTRRRGGRRSGRGRGRGYDDTELDDESGEGFSPSPSQVRVLQRVATLY